MNRNRVNKRKPRRIDPHLLAKVQASHIEPSTVIQISTEKLKLKPKLTLVEPKSLKDVAIHPLLLGNDTISTNQEPQKFKNPLKNGRRGFNVNPYLDQTAISKPHKRDLKFNELGKYITRANEIRESSRKAEEDAKRELELKSKGLFPVLAKGENLYQLHMPPSVEWWDQPYLKGRNYDDIDNVENVTFLEFTEDNPVTHYIQFPLLPSIKDNAKEMKIFLTKKELKKKRRVERLIKHKSEQEKIRAGLLPPPLQKIKLKNLMSVLTNDAIKDPTALELKISNQIEERKLQHELANQERKLKPEEKSLKLEQKQNQRLIQDGVHCGIFKINVITNFYKVNVNAMQMGLKGCTLSLKNGISMIIIEGDFKNVNKYTKLMLNRIDWTRDKQGNTLNNNKCELIANFKQEGFKFQKWFNKEFNDEDEMVDFLKIFNIDNYYRLI